MSNRSISITADDEEDRKCGSSLVRIVLLVLSLMLLLLPIPMMHTLATNTPLYLIEHLPMCFVYIYQPSIIEQSKPIYTTHILSNIL